MAVSYNLFTQAFLDKITEYDFLRLDDYTKNSMVDGYMKRACSRFNHICKYDISNGDDALREFDINIPEDEIDEILDIVSEGMLVQWMKPYVYRADNLENVLNTADISQYSPAELLYRISNAYDECKKDFTRLMRDYSYNHGDLTDLHL